VGYSRLALTDVGVLLPVTVGIYGIYGVRVDGRRRYFVLAGGAIGLAVGFKYTAGLLVVPFLVAAALRGAPRPYGVHGPRARGAAAAVIFLATTRSLS